MPKNEEYKYIVVPVNDLNDAIVEGEITTEDADRIFYGKTV